MSIKFVNLPKLLDDMKSKNRIIEVFSFTYNQVNCAVILTIYKEKEKKPSKYAQVKLEFLNTENGLSIFAYANFSSVNFNDVAEFIKFFNIQVTNGKAKIIEIFQSFSELFARYIPTVSSINAQYRTIATSRLEPNSPNAIYCYEVRRNGTKNGQPNVRSIENSQKAELLRPELYEKFKADTNFSFFFSDNPKDEKYDMEIIQQVARRQS